MNSLQAYTHPIRKRAITSSLSQPKSALGKLTVMTSRFLARHSYVATSVKPFSVKDLLAAWTLKTYHEYK